MQGHEDPLTFCQRRFHVDKLKDMSAIEAWWPQVWPQHEGADIDTLEFQVNFRLVITDLTAADPQDPRKKICKGGNNGWLFEVPFNSSRHADSGGTWYVRERITAAAVPALINRTFNQAEPSWPEAPTVSALQIRKSIRWPLADTRGTTWSGETTSVGCGLEDTLVQKLCTAASEGSAACDKCWSMTSSIATSGTVFGEANSYEESLQLLPRSIAPCIPKNMAGRPFSFQFAPPVTGGNHPRTAWLMLLHRPATGIGDPAIDLARAAIMSAKINAPSIEPIVIYIQQEPGLELPDAFTEWLEAIGVAWLPHRPTFLDEMKLFRETPARTPPSAADFRHATVQWSWMDAPGIFKHICGESGGKVDIDPGRFFVTTGGVLFADDIKDPAPARAIGGILMAVGSQATGAASTGGILDLQLMLMNATALLPLHSRTLAFARAWNFSNPRLMMSEYFIKSRGGDLQHLDDSVHGSRAFANPTTMPPARAKIWSWQGYSPQDIECWEAQSFKPGITLLRGKDAAPCKRPTEGGNADVPLHGCSLRTYAFLLSQHRRLVELSHTMTRG